MLPVPPTAVGPAISLDLDVDDVEMENYEVNVPVHHSKHNCVLTTVASVTYIYLCLVWGLH